MTFMHKNLEKYIIIIILSLIVGGCTTKVSNYSEANKFPEIFPDYQFVTIPSNIAPLNFKFVGESEKIHVSFKSKAGSVEISGDHKINFPDKKWKDLLEKAKGDSISVTVFSKNSGKWIKYKTFQIYVNQYDIDPYLAYRLIAPGYENWSKMGIYQRNLTNFDQKAIIENSLSPGSCVNCHSFKQNDPENMMFHFRSPNGGTMLLQNSKIQKLITKTNQTISNCTYPYWHPSGNYIAFSVNKISQTFHAVKDKRIEVIDSESDLVVYDIKKNEIITSDLLTSRKNFETFPTFTPDGKSLIFSSAIAKKIPEEYNQIRYNLNRIAFHPETGSFGSTIETLINADTLGKSISFPRVSPDGKFLMFTLANYGNFTIWHKEADLYMMNMETLDYFPLSSINSDNTESYHSWSSNSHWFVFSSRRIDGLYTRPYIACIDENGKTGKPFLLPQKDPDYYTFLLESFNIPELIKGPVTINLSEVEKLASSPKGEQVGFKKTN